MSQSAGSKDDGRRERHFSWISAALLSLLPEKDLPEKELPRGSEGSNSPPARDFPFLFLGRYVSEQALALVEHRRYFRFHIMIERFHETKSYIRIAINCRHWTLSGTIEQ